MSTVRPTDDALDHRLFLVAFDAERGAETFFLLRLVRWLREAGVEVELLLWRHGDLLEELQAECTRVRVVDDLTRWWLDRLLRAVHLGAVGARVKGLRMRYWLWRAARQHDLVLARGVRAARVAKYLKAPIVVSLSEEERPWTDKVAPEDWAQVLDRSRGFIVPDEATRALLVREHDVDPDRVEVQEGFLPYVAPVGTPVAGRGEVGIPDDAVLICGTGTDDWWRAPELVVPFVWSLCRQVPDLDVHFLWLCHDLGDRDALWPLRHDIANAGLQDRFHLAEVAMLLDQFELADLVVLTGRPDTFSLIAAELRLSARPVVCFANGVTERELGEAALAVPYLDVEGLATAVAGLLTDDEAFRRLGQHAVVAAGRAEEKTTDLPRWLLATTARFLA